MDKKTLLGILAFVLLPLGCVAQMSPLQMLSVPFAADENRNPPAEQRPAKTSRRVMFDPAKISGRVVDEAGNPIPNLPLILSNVTIRRSGYTGDSTWPPAETTTDASGRYQMDISPGAHIIQFSLPGREPEYWLVSLTVGSLILFSSSPHTPAFMVKPGAEIENMEITVAPRIRIRGRVLHADGTPLANADIQFSDEQRGFDGRSNSRHSVNRQTDAQGGYETFSEVPGIHTLTVEYQGLVARSEPIHAEAGARIDGVDLVLQTEAGPSIDEANREFQVPLVNVTDWMVNPSNGHAYKVIERGSWRNCETEAVAQGAHLVTINDEQEQAWLVQIFGEQQWYWIGLTDEAEEGNWKWVSGEPVTYTNWADIEPNNMSDGENYAIMNWPMGWNDLGPSSPQWPDVTKAIIEKEERADVISSLISQGGFSESEIQMLEALRFPCQFDRTGKEIKLPQETQLHFPVNGDFETGLDNWTKWFGLDRMNSQRSCEVVYDEEKGSNVVEFKRTGGGADGSLVGIVQDVYIDLSQYDELYLQLDMKSIEQTVPGGGWAGGSEYPVCIELAFIDQNGTPHRWQHGVYHYEQDKYPTSTRVEQGKWLTYTSPNLKELTPICGCEENVNDLRNWFGVETHRYDPSIKPKVITRVILFGGGWDFTGRADNLQLRILKSNPLKHD